MFRWLAGRGASDKVVQDVLARIDADLWAEVLQSLSCLRGLSVAEHVRLKQKTAWFLASKSFSAAHDFVLTDRIMLSIAVQATLPILNLETHLYEGWTQVIVYPEAFIVDREVMDDDGVVHRFTEPISGEAWEGGPVILSWEDVCAGPEERDNVVIHEFAHKIDLYDGVADGVPSLGRTAGLSPAQWQHSLTRALLHFREQLEQVEADIPHDVDPDSEQADPWYDRLPLDAYAAQDEAEFFAISSEAFFITPERLQQGLPDWYAKLQQFYRQDPLGRQRQSPST